MTLAVNRWPVVVMAAWLAPLLIAWLLYAQGLSGSFIFDDMPNLGRLSAIESGDAGDMLAFSLQGIAGPSGRPLSLLSFALQHESWPTAPADFKRANVLIHFINATLVLWLLITIQKARAVTGNALWGVPLLAATIWLLWPVQVSSVLYVVQRMTLLSGSCVLLGLILFVQARSISTEGNKTVLAHLLFLSSMAVGIGLGVLCKENAIVFPLLALTINATLLSHMPRTSRVWVMLLWAPVLALCTYLLLSDSAFASYQIRAFTLQERLLTESRVLWMYVSQILTPSAGSLRFLYDDFPISRSLLSPGITVVALTALLLVAAAAWRHRQRYPVLAFSVLFFLASHALESSLLPLELVFEHRNYVGSLALAYLLACSVWLLASSPAAGPRRLLAASGAIGTYLILVCIATWNLTALWGDPLAQKRFWFQQNQNSPRVHMELASQLLLDGYADAGAAQLEASSKYFPEEMGFLVARAELACYYPELRPSSLEPVRQSLRNGTRGAQTAIVYIDRMAVVIADTQCAAYSAAEVRSLIEAARSNPSFETLMQELLVLKGSLYSYDGQQDDARAALKEAIQMHPKTKLLVQAAVWEIGNNNLDEAESYIDALEKMRDASPIEYLAIRGDILKLQMLLADAKKRGLTSLP